MTAKPIFDIRKQVQKRNLEYMIVLPIMALALVFLGKYLMAETFVWGLSVDFAEKWDGWTFVGMVLIGTGAYYLIKTVIFAIRSTGKSGEWHFRLTSEELLWKVPDHSFGPEVGFVSNLANILKVEFRTTAQYDEADVREYWIHFRDRDPIQLMEYTGYSVSWLVSEIHRAGVPYDETFVSR
ncbi:hypothetical protein SAMN05444004_12431 [Jannaschia faecimaris]|uniref:Uncharacterized protein n=1 Tax=Jannaschia faecimaris TaxID=1244108 RepID=A0A1H3U8I8_9RHOB|nr:hypothetical protein [Jannaschia faecimaris]SDZ57879.1 hypothetical protein SAMN05444004_12431 [Jannaschia faecimaris]